MIHKTIENIGFSNSTNHHRPLKKAHRLYGKTFVLIDGSLVKDFKIDENTYFLQERTSDGILLRILRP